MPTEPYEDYEANVRTPDTADAIAYAENPFGNAGKYEMPDCWIDRGTPDADIIMGGNAVREPNELDDGRDAPWR